MCPIWSPPRSVAMSHKRLSHVAHLTRRDSEPSTCQTGQRTSVKPLRPRRQWWLGQAPADSLRQQSLQGLCIGLQPALQRRASLRGTLGRSQPHGRALRQHRKNALMLSRNRRHSWQKRVRATPTSTVASALLEGSARVDVAPWTAIDQGEAWDCEPQAAEAASSPAASAMPTRPAASSPAARRDKQPSPAYPPRRLSWLRPLLVGKCPLALPLRILTSHTPRRCESRSGCRLALPAWRRRGCPTSWPPLPPR